MDTQRNRCIDYPSIIFLIVAFWAMSARLTATQWIDELSKLEYSVILGILLGILVGISKFNRKSSSIILLLYSFILIPWQLTLTVSMNVGFNERFISLIKRINISILEFIRGQPVNDPILFLALVSIILWSLSVTSSYQLVRSIKPWIPISIAGMAIITIEYYNNYRSSPQWMSAIFIFFILLLIGRSQYLINRERWRRSKVIQDSEVGFELGRAIIIFSFLIVIVAWNLPSVITISNINNPYQGLNNAYWKKLREKLENIVYPLKNPQPLIVNIYSNSLPLGTGTTLSDEIVFSVEIPDSKYPNKHFYWHAQSYDYYSEGIWKNTLSEQMYGEPDDYLFIYPEWTGRSRIKAAFSLYSPITQVVYYPSLPVSVSRPFTAVYERHSNGITDTAALLFTTPLRAGEIYHILSWISTPTVEELKSAGVDYPDWVVEQYSQLPGNLSPRFMELAQLITDKAETPYDKSIAVTNYLRDQYTYQSIIQKYPTDIEPIEWFLFNNKTGFCNYFASTEVLLLRQLDIPSRLVVGYTEGENDPENNQFIVRQRDSHAWVEVYFPGIGWVEFEPTPSQPAIEFPLGSTNPSIGIEQTFQNKDQNDQDNQQFQDGEVEDIEIPETNVTNNYGSIIFGWLIFIVVITIICYFLWRILWAYPDKDWNFPSTIIYTLQTRGIILPIWLRQWQIYTLLSPIERLFSRIEIIERIAGLNLNPCETPSEQIERLISAIPVVNKPAKAFLNEYEIAKYSKNKLSSDIHTALNAARTIQKELIIFMMKKYSLRPILIKLRDKHYRR